MTRPKDVHLSRAFRVANRPMRGPAAFGKAAARELRQTAVRVHGSLDPPGIVRDVVITKILEITRPESGDLTPKILSAVTPTGFTTVRLVKLSVWGPTGDGNISVTFPLDGSSFSDYGTAGARRPVLHLQPPFALRQTWFKYDSTEVLARVTVPAASTSDVIHATVEMRATI